MLVLLFIVTGVVFCLWYLFLHEKRGSRSAYSLDEDEDPYADWENVEGAEHVTKLTDRNIKQFLKHETSVILLLYAPCKSIVNCQGSHVSQHSRRQSKY